MGTVKNDKMYCLYKCSINFFPLVNHGTEVADKLLFML